MAEIPQKNREIIIRVENLEYSYKGVKAVDGISFSVKKGEIFSFLGPNGAGKSTVINILITLLAKQTGTAAVAGYDVTKDPDCITCPLNNAGKGSKSFWTLWSWKQSGMNGQKT